MQVPAALERVRLAGFEDSGMTAEQVVEASASLVESGREAGRVVLDVADPPTAVIAQSDLLAAGDEAPSLLNGGLDKINPLFFMGIIIFSATVTLLPPIWTLPSSGYDTTPASVSRDSSVRSGF